MKNKKQKKESSDAGLLSFSPVTTITEKENISKGIKVEIYSEELFYCAMILEYMFNTYIKEGTTVFTKEMALEQFKGVKWLTEETLNDCIGVLCDKMMLVGRHGDTNKNELIKFWLAIFNDWDFSGK